VAEEYPKLRPLEALPHTDRGKPVIMLRDPTHLAPEMLVVSPEVYSLLPLLNGENSVLDIQTELTRRRGEIVFREHVVSLLSHLDKAHFLDNENFRYYHNDLEERFRNARVRPAFHAGMSYPAEQNELIRMLDSLYLSEEGAGTPGPVSKMRARALVVPHIDLRLGGAVYTHAYRVLAECRPPDLFVIIGTCHVGLPNLFSLSGKNFETPLGLTQADQEFLQVLNEVSDTGPFEEDLSHRSEHTIEFQLLFLQHVFRNRNLKVLPVLASFSYHDLEPSEEQSGRRELFRKFVEGLERAEQRSGKQVCYIASVDLAHMGPRYGDPFQPSEELIAETTAKDQQMLQALTSSDAAGFFEYIKDEQDRRRICGFPPLYTLIHLLGKQRGRLLSHAHSKMDEKGSFVTYASLAFTEPFDTVSETSTD
jgi:AmmeMemoRadiSam system protein B